MNHFDFDNLISERISKHCLPLFKDGYFKNSAREAMTQVELALKEKGNVKDKRYGITLIKSLFEFGGKKKNIKLRVPLGDDLQEESKNYLLSVFSYYRNYIAHNGEKINKITCQRILIIASELLDLLDASSLSYIDLGGLEGLLKAEVFENKEQLLNILKSLETEQLPDGMVDGLMERLEWAGFYQQQLDAIIELDLIRYKETEIISDYLNPSPYKTIGSFALTNLGQQFIDEINKRI